MSQPSSLLLVDADASALETLTFGFEREGCKVSGTSDPSRATQLAQAGTPELAVVAVREPTQPALAVIGGLKSAARDLPVVALGPSTLKPQAMAAGAADFLPLPIFLRDVISVGKLSALARRNSKPGDGSAKPEENQARLSEYFGIFYLLRAMASAERSGLLLVTRGNRRAEIRVHEGTVVSASIGALQGLPALHHVLLWEEAALSLTQRSVPQRSHLHLSAQEILDECERFLRDFAHAARDLGSPRTLYVPAAEPSAAMPGIQQSQVTPLLKLFDGHRVLSDVIEESPFRIFDTVRMIRRLREAGALVLRPDGLGQERTSGSRSVQPAPKSMLAEWALVPDQRGVVGDRRATNRRLRPLGGATPAAGSRTVGAPTPIPLLTKKGSGAAAAGEIAAARRRPTPASVANLAVAPTVQVRLDAGGVPIGEPLAPAAGVIGGPTTPPPVRLRGATGKQAPIEDAPPPRGRAGSGRQAPLEPLPAPVDDAPPPRAHVDSGRHRPIEDAPPRLELTPRPHRITGGSHGSAPDTFDAVEADFFAREADLYKREAIETFDDLDPIPGLPSGKRPRKK